MTDTLNLTRSDVESVMDYIWQHVRSSPNGKGYKTWQRMFEFVNGERPARQRGLGQGPLFAGLPDVEKDSARAELEGR